MKRLGIVLVGLVALGVVLVGGPLTGCDEGALGIGNPAAIYCCKLGYEFQIVDTPQGQYGICIFHDGNSCSAWRFLECNCGGSYSYCAIHGYDWVTKTDGQNPYSPEYCVCVSGDEEIGAVTELVDVEGGCGPLDTDGDGFLDSVEMYLGTDPDDDCADDPSDDAWPPDVDNDTHADIVDLLKFKPYIMTSAPPSPQRLDLDADGDIDIADVLKYKPIIMTSCTP